MDTQVAQPAEVMNFASLKIAVARQFERMQKFPMFRAAVEKDDLWATYLQSFPSGSNPIFRERTEHDCSCCKQFIRAVGDVVAAIDGKTVSVWDVTVAEPAYQAVSAALAALVKSKPIANAFLHYERTAGTDKNFEQMVDHTQTWNHFFVNIAPGFVLKKDAIATRLGEERSARDVLARSFETITEDAIETVLDLIANGSLYRGEEHKFAITEFRKLKREWVGLQGAAADLFVWTASKVASASVSRIRNTVIGTLLVDVAEGKELEDAVKQFEAKVAPANYKRPTALVSKAMIETAKATVAELGLTSALERRYAVLTDITVNNILFADRSARQIMTGSVFDELAASTSSRVKSMDKVEEVPIERFLADILPKAESIEVLFENKSAGNLVSLITSSDPTAGQLFKWDNNFSWSYNGEFADSIKERVKKAGGNVVGDLCCRLAWHNHDDLDFHMVEPDGARIYFADKRAGRGGGALDVDMNAGHGSTREPVENIFYGDRRRMAEGVYRLEVNQFCRRDSADAGFEVEIDYLGQVLLSFAYAKAMANRETIVVAKFRYSHAGGFELVESLPSSQVARQVWSLPTQTFHKVNVLMLSPNYWDDKQVGNKHYFFMMDGCANDGSARGFFNEFLDSRLDKHRKVFELVGSKMKPADSAQQLSGLGFSSTQRNTVTCRVKGGFSRTINVTF